MMVRLIKNKHPKTLRFGAKMRAKAKAQAQSNAKYSTAVWQKLRKEYLSRPENALCLHCTQAGLITPANEIDHIIRVADGGEFYDEDNWQALCKSCHSKKTYAETLGKSHQTNKARKHYRRRALP